MYSVVLHGLWVVGCLVPGFPISWTTVIGEGIAMHACLHLHLTRFLDCRLCRTEAAAMWDVIGHATGDAGVDLVRMA